MNLFDIIGPVMIGPSSSHTAGAARIGRVARRLFGEMPEKAVISFHGSFAKTWQGHGTDRAVLGGLLDMNVDDERLRDSREWAHKAGLIYNFMTMQLKNAHPNTIVIQLYGKDGKTMTVQAASVGGGRILVQYLNGLEVDFSGEATTLIIQHKDAPGAIAEVTGALAKAGLNIATMRDFRREAGGDAVMALEMDEVPPHEMVKSLEKLKYISAVTLLPKN